MELQKWHCFSSSSSSSFDKVIYNFYTVKSIHDNEANNNEAFLNNDDYANDDADAEAEAAADDALFLQ